MACHGVDHWQPKPEDVFRSKEIIEEVTGLKVEGYRQPRMFPVSEDDIEKAGYLYNSSLNPAFIPGRYMHLTTPRTWFMQGKVMQIPASVSPHLRIPLFWLSLHNFPEWFYLRLVRQVLRHDGYFVTYFHPWEFMTQVASRVQDAFHHQKPQWTGVSRTARPLHQSDEGRQTRVYYLYQLCA